MLLKHVSTASRMDSSKFSRYKLVPAVEEEDIEVETQQILEWPVSELPSSQRERAYQLWQKVKKLVDVSRDGRVIYKGPNLLGSSVLSLLRWILDERPTKERPWDALKWLRICIRAGGTKFIPKGRLELYKPLLEVGQESKEQEQLATKGALAGKKRKKPSSSQRG